MSIKERYEICTKCPLFTDDVCNPRIYMKILENGKEDVSFVKKDGYESGCGCYIPMKIKHPDNKCPFGKW